MGEALAKACVQSATSIASSPACFWLCCPGRNVDFSKPQKNCLEALVEVAAGCPKYLPIRERQQVRTLAGNLMDGGYQSAVQTIENVLSKVGDEAEQQIAIAGGEAVEAAEDDIPNVMTSVYDSVANAAADFVASDDLAERVRQSLLTGSDAFARKAAEQTRTTVTQIVQGRFCNKFRKMALAALKSSGSTQSVVLDVIASCMENCPEHEAA